MEAEVRFRNRLGSNQPERYYTKEAVQESAYQVKPKTSRAHSQRGSRVVLTRRPEAVSARRHLCPNSEETSQESLSGHHRRGRTISE